MCLEVVTKIHSIPKRLRTYKVGYKIFRKSKKGFVHAPIYGVDGDIPLDEFISSTNGKILSVSLRDGAYHYERGFHIFLDRKHALKVRDRHFASTNVVRKVLFNYVTAEGRQYSTDVVVAKRMKVPKVRRTI